MNIYETMVITDERPRAIGGVRLCRAGNYPFQRDFTSLTSICVNVPYMPIPPLFGSRVSAYAAIFFGGTPAI